MEIVSYILSIIGLVLMITASLIKGKNMKTILVLVSLSNLIVGTSYLCGGSGINGAAALYLGCVQTLINFTFEYRNKPIPKWLIAIYAAAIIAVNLAVSEFSPLVLLVIVASLTFLLCIGQKNGAKYRFWTIVNISLWCLYDVLSASYGALITHGSLLTFTAVGMLIHDRKAEGQKNK